MQRGHCQIGSAEGVGQVQTAEWRGAESNRRHLDFQSSALPD